MLKISQTNPRGLERQKVFLTSGVVKGDMYISAVVVAAGKGLRLGSKTSKPLIRIKSKPLIIYSLEVLNKYGLIKEIIVVVNSQNYQEIINKIKQYKISKITDVVLGGTKRKDSVYNGLKAVNKRTDFVLIHDAARPFINNAILSSVIQHAKKYGAAIVGVPVKATIKQVTRAQEHKGARGFVVDKTIDRENLWEVQTPQVFKKDLLLEAYDNFRDIDVTDEAMLLEKMGVKVGIVFGSYDNIKITTPEDLIIAEAILNNKLRY